LYQTGAKTLFHGASFQGVKRVLNVNQINVFDSMTLENTRKIEIIKTEVPTIFRGLAGYFAAAKGTPMYEGLRTRELEYLCYALRKQPTIKDEDLHQIMAHIIVSKS
jgi:hypothetical protein